MAPAGGLEGDVHRGSDPAVGQAGAGGAGEEGAELGQLGDRGPQPGLAVLAHRRSPPGPVVERPRDDGVDLLAGAGPHAEVHVPAPATGNEVLGVAGGGGPGGEPPSHRPRLVTRMVAGPEGRGQGGDGLVRQLRVVPHLGGGGIARAQPGTAGVTGGGEAAEPGVEA